MQRHWRLFLTLTLATVIVAGSSPPRVARAGDWWETLRRGVKAPAEAIRRQPPQVAHDPAIEQLAEQIDWLEHFQDSYGSIVAKQPNVWGEARLTRHRDEYERMMAAELAKFHETINGALRRSDQAYLSMALALQGAVTGQDIPGLNKPDEINATMATVTELAPASSTAIFRNEPFASQSAFITAEQKVSLEPTVFLEQMSRYLNHLHALRRINEGDDTADSPGYSLNLVRIPVSVLTGKHTRKGYGAEITITAKPYLSDELLPTTFRSLVIQDIVEHAGLPLTRHLNSNWAALVTQRLLERPAGNQENSRELIPPSLPQPDGIQMPPSSAPAEEELQPFESARPVQQRGAAPFSAAKPHLREELYRKVQNQLFPTAEPSPAGDTPSTPEEITTIQLAADSMLVEQMSAPTTALSRTRNAQLPYPNSQLMDVFGAEHAGAVISQLREAFAHDLINQQIVHMTDVEAFLQSELTAAYEMLSQADYVPAEFVGAAYDESGNPSLWSSCTPQLAQAIRLRQKATIADLRTIFTDQLRVRRQTNCELFPPTQIGINQLSPQKKHQRENELAIEAYAWAIIVESAILNERLQQDMREAAARKGCYGLPDYPLDFFGPRPGPEARQAFNAYVECRWPIQVFALDPVTQDQNIGDEYSRRRETQLALAMAFAGGQINAQTMNRFSRRLEWDMATIALNRTAIGFSHGHDTFGWRFMPRFQSPPVRGNIAAFGETLFGGPTTEQDLNQRELEPGQRECTAVILMPSFVPYCTFSTRSNWFRLTNPAQTELAMHDILHVSRAIATMHESAAQCSKCAHLYRPGEVTRLMRRVHQLDRELPMQTMRVQVPYENTLGGFEMFSSGTTDLAPELHGWYGAPGMHPGRPTTMYLVGNHFSVHDTRLLAGGQPIEFRQISRRLLEAYFPAGLTTVPDFAPDLADPSPHVKPHDAFVDVHVATPYGVSGQHLLIPMLRDDEVFDNQFRLESVPLELFATLAKETGVAAFKPFYAAAPRQMVIHAPMSARPPTTGKFRFSVVDLQTGLNLGTFDTEDAKKVPFNSTMGEYVIDGPLLADMVGDLAAPKQLTKNIADYLKYLNSGSQNGLSHSFQLQLAIRIRLLDAAVQPIEVAGQWNVRCQVEVK